MNQTSSEIGKLILRLTVAGLMLFHGIFKLKAGIDWMAEPLGAVGLPLFVAYGVYVGEILAPLLLIAGFATRLAALTIAFDMFMAVFLVLRDKVLTTTETSGAWGIEVEAFFFFTALAIFFLGAGRLRPITPKSRWLD